jgi:diaminohydroxyphosphoribosylaminopyrimidine deaminase/5-amino-6-(5-phosphoribosylamino)uracil reductase
MHVMRPEITIKWGGYMHLYSHDDYMQQALQLAEQGCYTVSPNPMVGCIIVKNHVVVGRGYHHHAGGAHAEVNALNEAGSNAKGSTVYVTLEPCAHFGKTPPCVDALIRAEVSSVFIACLDPNPLVDSKGIQALQAAGIQVETGLRQAQAKQLNNVFFHYIKHKRPYVISKWAMSLDGLTTTHVNDTRQISGEGSLANSHELRRRVDAILVGANTIRSDNPALTARCIPSNQVHVKQPIRIILTTTGELPLDATVFAEDHPGKTLIASTTHHPTFDHIEQLCIPSTEKGLIDLPLLLDELGKRSITSLLIEGGMEVHQQFAEENLINQFHVYIANKFIGKLPKKRILQITSCQQVGDDYLLISEAGGE